WPARAWSMPSPRPPSTRRPASRCCGTTARAPSTTACCNLLQCAIRSIIRNSEEGVRQLQGYGARMITAVYPGTFDPLTRGHEDLVRRAAALFDKVVVGIAHSRNKKPFFSIDERVEIAREVLGHYPNVEVQSFAGLLKDRSEERRVGRGWRWRAERQAVREYTVG